VASSLEGSNTDIADEFTKLIVTQQAYSSNTRVITTTNQMVQDLLNVIR
jgi:flagellar hook protein FlgE